MNHRLRTTLITWLVVYPMITGLLALLEPFVTSWPMPLRTLLLTALMVPLMVLWAAPSQRSIQSLPESRHQQLHAITNTQQLEKIMTQTFSQHFAPHLGLMSPDEGMFRTHAGDDPVDQIHFMADEGFTAIEDNFMAARSIETQEAIGKALRERDMRMGVIVNTMVYDSRALCSTTRTNARG